MTRPKIQQQTAPKARAGQGRALELQRRGSAAERGRGQSGASPLLVGEEQAK